MQELSKSSLRNEAKRKRELIINKSEKDKRIADSLFTLIGDDVKTVFCYSSFENEIDTRPIISSLLQNITVGLPVCLGEYGYMKFYSVSLPYSLILNKFGIGEPDIIKEKELKSADIIIVPALCFTRKGYRLGYGGGYYDRFLKEYKGTKIGLCYSGLVYDELPVNDFDVPVDYIVTENEIINCKTEE